MEIHPVYFLNACLVVCVTKATVAECLLNECLSLLKQPECETSLPSSTENPDPPLVAPRVDIDPSPAPNLHIQTQKINFLSQENQKRASLSPQTQSLPLTSAQSPPTSRARAASADRLLDRLKFSPAGEGLQNFYLFIRLCFPNHALK